MIPLIANSLSEIVKYVTELGESTKNLIVFRGEMEDFRETALVPLVYRYNYIHSEDRIFRESQRFNDMEFLSDTLMFDRLSRAQHYSAPTRLMDVSQDLFSAIYFAVADKSSYTKSAIIYVMEIAKDKIKYFDSDVVSVIANVAKLPLRSSGGKKSKEQLVNDLVKYRYRRKKFNATKSCKFLLHEIREEKHYFLPIIEPRHLASVQYVLPKLTSNRVRSQKGAFLLFGLNPSNYRGPIKLLEDGKLAPTSADIDHPIAKLHQIHIPGDQTDKIKAELRSVGIQMSFIYPEIDKVSEFLKSEFKN